MPVLACLFAAAIIVASVFGSISGPVPITLQNLFVLVAALFLGPAWGGVAVALYLGLGALGVPVFSKGGAGLAHLFGPTGGYLLAYLVAAPLAGFIAARGEFSWKKCVFASTSFMLALYAIGVPWLKYSKGFEWGDAIAFGMLPFLLVDAIKVALATAVATGLVPWFRERLGAASGGDA
jgi:biotin transport system substrate-specific component